MQVWHLCLAHLRFRGRLRDWLCLMLCFTAFCMCALALITPASSPFKSFCSRVLSLSCYCKLLGTCLKWDHQPLINTTESSAGSSDPRPVLSSGFLAEISCISQTISPSPYVAGCFLEGGLSHLEVVCNEYMPG